MDTDIETDAGTDMDTDMDTDTDTDVDTDMDTDMDTDTLHPWSSRLHTGPARAPPSEAGAKRPSAEGTA
eukprot:14561346-Alexandrium_andersonii.AAC.1